MKGRTLLVALAIAAPFAAALLPVAESAGTTRLIAMGDTSANSNTQRNVDGALADGAQGWLGLGDYNYDHSVSAWKTMFAPLNAKGAHLAIGNHDDRSSLSELFPQGTQWSKSINGVRVVAINGMRDFAVGSTDHKLIRGWLCGASESTKIVITHHNWWLESGAHHPGSEFRASEYEMDKMMKECGVDLVLAGHEHNYQRMVRNGIQYVIAGTGGRGLYPVAGTPDGTVATCGCLGRLVLDVGSTGYTARFKTLDGTVKDTFSSGSVSTTPTSPTSGTTTFTPKAAQEWWVQVKVSGTPRAVEARDTGGAWKPLSLKSWGDWAGSFHVEPGHDVQYRATLSDGRVVESCWYDGTRCASAPTTTQPAPQPAPTGSTTFTPKVAQEWWVQVKVSGTPRAVEARDTGGTWKQLSLKSWGDWAGSFHVEPGHDVQYRATLSDGRIVASCWYDGTRCAASAS